jgi:hypothetical protein
MIAAKYPIEAARWLTDRLRGVDRSLNIGEEKDGAADRKPGSNDQGFSRQNVKLFLLEP